MKLVDLGLFVGGTIIALVGLCRLTPNVLQPKVWQGALLQSTPMILTLIVLVFWTLHKGGATAMMKGVQNSFFSTGVFFPTLALFFPVMAFGGVVASFYGTEITQMLQGKFGFPGTMAASCLVPTINAVIEPIKSAWAQPEMRPILLYYMTAAALICWAILPFRALGLSWEIAGKMYLVNCAVAIGIMPFFWLWSRAVAAGSLWNYLSSFFASNT
jgi:hypothetical protein